MAEPVTAAVIAGVVVTAAAKNIGARIGDEIAKGIFGKDTSLDEIQTQLEEMSVKLDTILSYSRATFILVENIPNIVADKLDGQSLYHAHNKLTASYDAYMLSTEWHGTIGYETLVSLIENWNVIIDKEDSTEQLIKMPRYAEHMLIVTHGQLIDVVTNGITEKRDVLDTYIKTLIEQKINPLVVEAERHLSSGYVKSGNLLDSAPWLTWTMNGTRNKTVKRQISMPCEKCNGKSYTTYEETIPDTGWNTALADVNTRLHTIATELDEHFRLLHSATTAHTVLDIYLTRLTDGAGIANIASMPHIKIIENKEFFPPVET